MILTVISMRLGDSPIAIAVIGGFTTSTLLTLVVVPVLFTYVDGIYHWLRKLKIKN